MYGYIEPRAWKVFHIQISKYNVVSASSTLNTNPLFWTTSVQYWHFFAIIVPLIQWKMLFLVFCGILISKRQVIAILTVYKQLFWYWNFVNHRTKESFVTATNKPLVGTLMTIGDVTVSIAIRISRLVNDNQKWNLFTLPILYLTLNNYAVSTICFCFCEHWNVKKNNQ